MKNISKRSRLGRYYTVRWKRNKEGKVLIAYYTDEWGYVLWSRYDHTDYGELK